MAAAMGLCGRAYPLKLENLNLTQELATDQLSDLG